MQYNSPTRDALSVLFLLGSLALSSTAVGQTGVSGDRVSLPEGPGSLEGVGENVGVTANMGSMTHQVSIGVPSGFAAVTPSITLSYSSGNGDSIAGMGWSMETPSIERTTFRGLPEYNREDTFCVNGSEQLVRLPDTDPPMYRARYEGGFVRYTWLAADDGTEGHWLAEYPDGSKGYFGASEDGANVSQARVGGVEGTFRYHLVEKVDVYGHKLRYTYQKDGVVSLVSHIGYVFTNGPDPTYEVTFEYEPRADDTRSAFLSDAKPGFNELLSERLAAISVHSRGTSIRRYALTYEPYASSGGFTRLSRVEAFGAQGNLFEAASHFEYSQTLGGQQPFVVDMGTLGIALSTGSATLLDINGDGLPDILDATQPGAHRFFLNLADTAGTSTFDTNATESAIGTRSSHPLGGALVQVLDLNGDGFTDIINAATGQILVNNGSGDWLEAPDGSGIAALANALDGDFDAEDGELQTLRFIDYDNDKKIDVMKSTSTETSVFKNMGAAGFEIDETVETLGLGFAEDGIQLTDMNGDGLLDAVKLQVGSMVYRLNHGRGLWGPRLTIDDLPLTAQQVPLAALEDINGDGLADLVVAFGESVTYALNTNTTSFAAPVQLTSADVSGTIPQSDTETTVLYADMNANGSTDIVWISNQGHVQMLELFPVRPNLITKITNGIGMVTEVTYTTSAVMMARNGGWESWRYKLPFPMNIVDTIDRYDLQSDLHQINRYTYGDGFYDGEEKQFRGFEQVTILEEGDEAHESGRVERRYDVGAEDTYRKDLLLSETVYSSDRALNTSTMIYSDCPLAEIDDLDAERLSFPIRFVCQIASEYTLKEGADPSEWATTATEMVYDGYGNVALNKNLGITSMGGQGCASCGDRGLDDFGEPCGAQCLGDEMFVEADFVPPSQTSGLWLLRAPFRTRTYGREGSPLTTESNFYYDGEAFEGLPLGFLTRGDVTRATQRFDVGAGDIIEADRRAFDGHGNLVERLDPLGEPGGTTHRTLYTYNAEFLYPERIEFLLEDPEGNPYRLRTEYEHDPRFDKKTQTKALMRVVDGQVVSTERSRFFEYDEFGRTRGFFLPGNNTGVADIEYEYELASPVSRIIGRRNTERGQSKDLEVIRCYDGRHRLLQTRARLEDGRYFVTGFKRYDVRSKPVRVYQPYTSDTSACESTPPSGTLFTAYRYDGAQRIVEIAMPDADIYGGTPSIVRKTYGPLVTSTTQGRDHDPDDPAFETPTIKRINGLGQATLLGRTLSGGELVPIEVHYDSLGRMTGYTDPGGNTKEQTYDLLGRLVKVVDPNSAGETRMEYNDASMLVSNTDDRDIVTRFEYDGLNRITTLYDEADREGSRISWRWDVDPDCPAEVCSNTEGQLASVSYPELDGRRAIERSGFDLRGRDVYGAIELGDHTYAFARRYDNSDRLLAVDHPNGRTVEYTHDNVSRMVAIPGIVHTIDYDDRGQPSQIGFEDGSGTAMTYDDKMRVATILTEAGDTRLQGFGFTYNRDDNLTSIEDLADAVAPRPDFGANFTYDAWNRPIEARFDRGVSGAETLSYGFDRLDNLTARTSDAGVDSSAHIGALSYDSFAPNALTDAAGQALDYDAAGHMLRRGEQTLTWDFMGRMTHVERDGEALGRYVYGSDQSRVIKREDGSTTLYASPDFEVRDGISTLYIKLGPKRVARIEDASLAATVLPDPDANGQINAADAALALADNQTELTQTLLWSSVRRLLVEVGPDNGTAWLHTDHLGSITLATGVVDGDPTVLGRRAFYPMGTERPDGFGYVDEYGFTGQEHDRATGLVHFDWRYYDPKVGRWLSIDPLFATANSSTLGRLGESTTAYTYLAGHFINKIDPTGLATGKSGAAGGHSQALDAGSQRRIKSRVSQLKSKQRQYEAQLKRAKKRLKTIDQEFKAKRKRFFGAVKQSKGRHMKLEVDRWTSGFLTRRKVRYVDGMNDIPAGFEPTPMNKHRVRVDEAWHEMSEAENLKNNPDRDTAQIEQALEAIRLDLDLAVQDPIRFLADEPGAMSFDESNFRRLNHWGQDVWVVPNAGDTPQLLD